MKNFSLKDQLFNAEKVSYLSSLLQKAYPKFQRKRFEKNVLAEFPKLELKERIVHIRKMLKENLPNEYQKAVNYILKSLPDPLNPNLTDNDFGDFIFAPLADYVAAYGCEKKYITTSLNALKEITMRFSSEYAIRSFLNAFPTQTLNTIKKWQSDKNYHVRRLCSEGLRPKLPWGMKINIDYKTAAKPLNALFQDSTRYVTRSVANHLNDISKIDPDFVLKTLKDWKKQKLQMPSEMDFIIKHSLRTLVKKGHAPALNFLGFSSKPNIKIKKFTLKNKTVKLGSFLEFDLEIQSLKKENLNIDYRIEFEKKQKVFKLKNVSLKKNQKTTITKKHPFKKNMTTRKIDKGLHRIVLQINGVDTMQKEFNILS